MTNLEEMLNDLEKCRNSEGYTVEYLKPSELSIDITKHILEETSKLIDGDIPLGDLFAGGDEDVRIEWEKSENISVSLVIHFNGCGYIYWGKNLKNGVGINGEDYGTSYNLTPQNLAHYLRKMQYEKC